MPSDPRYDRLTAESMPLEKANVETLLKDTGRHSDNQGRATKSPWRMSKPSKRVSNCPITLWLYNTSPRKIDVPALPGMPKVLAPCPEGKQFSTPIAIREITLDYASRGDYKLEAVEVDDIDLASNILCPACQGNGDDCKYTGDLRMWGVFYSAHDPADPIDEAFQKELDVAKTRLVQTMSNVVKFGDKLWEDQRQRWQLEGAYGNVYRMAAKYMHIQRPWCTALKDMVTCVGCGQSNPSGAMLCSNTVCGIILDYKKARKFRKITQAEYEEAEYEGLVPEDKVAVE